MTTVLNLGGTIALASEDERPVTLSAAELLGESNAVMVDLDPVQSNGLSWARLLAIRHELLSIVAAGASEAMVITGTDTVEEIGNFLHMTTPSGLPDLVPSIESYLHRGGKVVITSLAPHGRVEPVYPAILGTSHELLKAGAYSAGTLTARQARIRLAIELASDASADVLHAFERSPYDVSAPQIACLHARLPTDDFDGRPRADGATDVSRPSTRSPAETRHPQFGKDLLVFHAHKAKLLVHRLGGTVVAASRDNDPPPSRPSLNFAHESGPTPSRCITGATTNLSASSS